MPTACQMFECNSLAGHAHIFGNSSFISSFLNLSSEYVLAIDSVFVEDTINAFFLKNYHVNS